MCRYGPKADILDCVGHVRFGSISSSDKRGEGLGAHDRRLAMPLQTDKPSQAAHFPLLSKNGQSERAGRYFDYDKLEY
jgi:hypothetical protein